MTAHIHHGFPAHQRPAAAKLFWQAFQDKLTPSLGPEAKALRFLQAQLNPRFALTAQGKQGELLGLVGFKTPEGGLLTGTTSDVIAHYGLFGGLARAALLEAFARPLPNGTLHMDGLIVPPRAQGQGVGTMLLTALSTHASTSGYTSLRLDVSDTNHRARALYDRHGFTRQSHRSTGLLAPLMGYKSATTLIKDLAQTT